MLIALLPFYKLLMLIQDTVTGRNTGQGGDVTGKVANFTSQGDVLFLLLSGGFLAISIFLLYQAVSFQRWVTKEDKDAPDPDAGLQIAWGTICCTIAIWIYYLYLQEARYLSGNEFVIYLINNPKKLAPALLLASCVPGFLSLFKFAFIASLARSASAQGSEASRSPMAVVAGFAFSAISLAGSIATLIQFFR
jgi:hypothetical protein